MGATDFLAKPVDESELVLRLRNTLVAKRYLDQQTFYDRVTGLANRRYFLDCLGRVVSWSERESSNSAVLLIETGIAPHCLTLELTESVMIEDVNENIEVLYALKALGVKLSIDDFGTGYSSLSYLEQFPLDELKVDRSFIGKIDSVTGEAPIVSAIIAMAHSLRFCVVAEGVETEQQLGFIRKNKCEQYQGYLFSKPLPADEFAAFLGRSRTRQAQ